MSQLFNHVRIVCAKPEVGMGVTVFHYTDRSAGTVHRISKSGKTVWFKPDKAVRVDSNGMSECQSYTFSPIPDATPIKATLRKDGQWRISKDGKKIAFGHREAYHDFSF